MVDEEAGPQEGAVRARRAAMRSDGAQGPRRRASAWAGAATALALLAAMGLWVWDVGTRETAAVPVIAAYVGPIKLPPPREEDGRRSHADMSAYELAGARPDAPMPVAYAPDAPAPMEEDVALGRLEPLGERAPAGLPATVALPQGSLAGEGPQLSALTPDIPVPRAALVPDPATDAASQAEAIASELSTPVQSEPVPPAGTGSALAPAAAPVAFRRPERIAALSAEPDASPPADRLAAEAADAPYQLQLGAFLSREETVSEWRRISERYPELLHNRALAMQTTQSGGQTYYRLRVGPFTSLIEAASLCEALKARSQDCIPAANR